MAIFGNTPADEMTLIERDAANRAAAYENLKRSGDLPALGLIFGLNLMKNSQTQGFGQALGGAGMDALANHKAIMEARKKGIDADLNRQTELMRAQEQLNRQDRNFDLDVQKWDYQKEQDAIRNAMERKRIAQAGASSAIAAKRLQFEMDQAAAEAERKAKEREMLASIFMGDPKAQEKPEEPGLPQIADIPLPVEQDPFGASEVPQPVQSEKAPESPAQERDVFDLTQDQVRRLTMAAIDGNSEAKSLLNFYMKQQENNNGKPVSEYQKEFDKEVAKQDVKRFSNIINAGDSASVKIGKLRMVKDILDSGLYTGFGGNITQKVREGLVAVGLGDKEAAANAEMLQRLSNELALEGRQTSEGGGMPGSMSDGDRKFLVEMAPGLTKTVEGNRMLVEMALRVEERKSKIAEMANAYYAEHGKLDAGFNNVVKRYVDSHSLFSGMRQTPSAPSVPGMVDVGTPDIPDDISWR